MVVRDRIGRRRYIIVQNSEKLKKLIGEMKKIDRSTKIILRLDNFAVIFCRHWYKEDIIEYLQKRGVKTYRTTGTIKKARRIISALQGCGGGGGYRV